MLSKIDRETQKQIMERMRKAMRCDGRSFSRDMIGLRFVYLHCNVHSIYKHYKQAVRPTTGVTEYVRPSL